MRIPAPLLATASPLRRCILKHTLPPRAAPLVAVVADPVQQGAFEAYVVACFFGLYPLVAQDLLALGQKLFVHARFFSEERGVVGVPACA